MFAVRFPKNIDRKLKRLKALPENYQRFVEDASLQVAEEYKKRLIEHIDNQDLKFKPLSPKYLQFKINNELSTNIWEASGVLKNSITVQKIDNLYFTGILNNERYPDTDTPVALVAAVLEFGSPTRNIPPRPLFRTTRREIRRELKKFFNGEAFLTYLENK